MKISMNSLLMSHDGGCTLLRSLTRELGLAQSAIANTKEVRRILVVPSVFRDAFAERGVLEVV